MDKSERIERIEEDFGREFDEIRERDNEFSDRICALLNHPKINRYCMVDAYYYDYSVIPRDKKDEFNLCRDVYLIFGITTDAEIVSKWVYRSDLDSDDDIVDGKVIHVEKHLGIHCVIPCVDQLFNRNMLLTPIPDIFNIKKSIKKEKEKNIEDKLNLIDNLNKSLIQAMKDLEIMENE